MTPDNKPAAPGLVEALKPCPFCGNKDGTTIESSHMFLLAPVVLQHRCADRPRHSIVIGGDTESEVAAAWNARAALSQPVPSAPEPTEAIAQLRHLIDDLVVTYQEDGLERHMVRDGAGLLFSNFVGAVRRLLASLPAPPVPAAAPAVEPTELQRQVRDLTDTELGTLLTPYEAKNFSGLLKKVRALIDAALPASPEPATQGAAKPVHTNHPFQHWDRTCPACVLEASPPVPEPLTPAAGEPASRVEVSEEMLDLRAKARRVVQEVDAAGSQSFYGIRDSFWSAVSALRDLTAGA